jgi:glycerol-3-phosphate dehydrogenase
MQKMGYADEEEMAKNILREVDFGRKGHIELHDFLDVSGLSDLRVLETVL